MVGGGTTAAWWRMPDLAFLMVLALLAPAGVPLLLETLATLAELPVLRAVAVRVDFDDGVFVKCVDPPWPLDLPEACLVDLRAEARLLPRSGAGSSGAVASSTSVNVAWFATRADAGTVSLAK